MSTDTEAPASPFLERLAALEPETCVCVVLAQVVWGATWSVTGGSENGPTWWFFAPDKQTLFVVWPDGPEDLRLPNPLRDPAAAYDLEERELCGWETNRRLDGRISAHRFAWLQANGFVSAHGPWHTNRKHAAVLAALHKHEKGPYALLVRLALEKMSTMEKA